MLIEYNYNKHDRNNINNKNQVKVVVNNDGTKL